jgi:hypothetical protein
LSTVDSVSPSLPKGLLERGAVSLDLAQAIDRFDHRQRHLHAGLDRPTCLILQARRPAVPEQVPAPGLIQGGRRVPADRLAFRPDGLVEGDLPAE